MRADAGGRGLAATDAALADYPADPRLLFLRGSLLAGLQRYDEARAAIAGAVELAPEFAIARFQLGFLQLTSGAAREAETTWAPLRRLRPRPITCTSSPPASSPSSTTTSKPPPAALPAASPSTTRTPPLTATCS